MVAEDLATPGRVAEFVFWLGLQLVLGHVDHDFLAVVLNVQVGPGDVYLALTEPEKAADPDHDAVDVAIGADVDRRDLPDRVVLGILNLAADQLARVGCRGGRRQRADRRLRRRRAGGLLRLG